MVLFPIQLSKNKKPGWVPGRDEEFAKEGTDPKGRNRYLSRRAV
jgi:hypothetical protein